jgi:hypothetical protein
MKFMNQARLFGTYQEEAGGEDAGGGGGDAPPAADDDAAAVAAMAKGDAPPSGDAPTAPEWLLGKYHTEGKSVEEATTEQAKAYNELSGKFGAFTGAPEEYAIALSEELTEAGVTMDKDDPMVEAAMKFAKESNMSQEGLSGMLNLYAMQMAAEQQADTEYKAEQMKALGPNAESRIQNIQQWAGKNLDPETVASLEGMATSVESVKAIERLISMTRGAAVDVDNTVPAAGAGAEDVAAMQFEKDGNGNRRIQTDPAFKARYQKLRNEVYGTDEHRVMVG